MIMQDQHKKSFPRIPRDNDLRTADVIATASSFGILVLLVSLMGWCSIDYPKPTPAPQLTKEQMYQLTAKELAEQMARINEEMERRVHTGGK